MGRRTWRGVLGALGLAAGLLTVTTAGTAPASAAVVLCSPAHPSTAAAALGQVVAEDLATLGDLTAQVQASTTLSAADRATLLTDLGDETSGLQDLAATVTAATTCAELRAARRSLVLTYRVGEVMAPQARLVLAADRLSAVATTLAGYQVGLEKGTVHGASTAVVDQLDASGVHLAAAERLLDGVSGRVLAQTPAGAPGNRAVFETALEDLRRASAQLQASSSHLRQVVTALH